MRMIACTLFTLFIGFSCQNRAENDLLQYENGKQLLTLNDLKRNGQKFVSPRILKMSKEPVFKGEEFLVKIFLERSNLKLVDAFIDCKAVINPMVDTVEHKVSGCSTGLLVQNDTIIIGFRPTQFGIQQFPEITILTKDGENIFRTLKYSFSYSVTE